MNLNFGALPDGYLVVRPGTFSDWLVWRNFPVNGDPKPAVDQMKKYTRIYPLSKAANPPKITFINVSGMAFSTLAPAD